MDAPCEVVLVLDGSDHRAASLQELLRELIYDAAASGSDWIRMTSSRAVDPSEIVHLNNDERF